jgi:hypothetical protein
LAHRRPHQRLRYADSLKFPLEASTALFSVALGLTFAVWYANEKTLSIHSIFTRKREAFYWATILFTFALGTATGDLVAEKLGVGYLGTGILVLGIIAAAGIAYRFGLNSVLAFWVAYILTRPLGASLGDFLSQSKVNGGLGLGATITSAIFLGVLLGLGISGYYLRRSQLQASAQASVSPDRPLGDLSTFRAIALDMSNLVKAGDWNNAKSRATDLESAWDDSAARLQAMNPAKWTQLDNAIDGVLKKTRASSPDAAAALQTVLGVIDSLDRGK